MKRKPLYILYIPGLGDHKISGQLKALKLWRRYGVHSEILQKNWADGEAWQPKFDRMLKRIDELVAKGNDVGLVGVSAGGSATINAFAARKDSIVGVVLIAGKVNHPSAISSSYAQRNPAFATSVNEAQKSLEQLDDQDRQRIMSRYGAVDLWVPRRDSVIPGAMHKRVPSTSHFFTIASQITIGAPAVIKFLKKQQNR